MKNLKNNLKRTVIICGAICLSSMFLTSCLKDHNDYVKVPTALLLVVQGSPDAPTEGIRLDNNWVTINGFNYEDNIGYFSAYTGNRRVGLYTGSSTIALAADTIHLDADKVYSLFLANTYTHPDFILLNDTLKAPAAGKASIRLVNASTDAGSVDLVVTTPDVLVSGQAYKTASAFTAVAGDKYYDLSVRAHGTNTVLATLTNVHILSGGVYTVWLHGLVAGSGTSKVQVGVINNARF